MMLRNLPHASLAGVPIMLRKGWPNHPAKLRGKWPHDPANRHKEEERRDSPNGYEFQAKSCHVQALAWRAARVHVSTNVGARRPARLGPGIDVVRERPTVSRSLRIA